MRAMWKALLQYWRERENDKQSEALNDFQKLSFFGSAIASLAQEPKAKKQKINKKCSDSKSILVQSFARWGEEFHAAEAEIMLDSDGASAIEYVAAKLLLKGTLYVSDILGRQ